MGFWDVSHVTVVCFGMIHIVLVMHIVGFATTGWTYHSIDYWRIKFGLWRYDQCTSYTFQTIQPHESSCQSDWIQDVFVTLDWKMDARDIANYRVYITGWIRASQVLECISLALYFICCVLSVVYIFKLDARDSTSRVDLGFVILSMVSSVVALVGAVIYAIHMMERCWYSSAGCTMGYSFGLVIAACILAILSAALKILEMVGMFDAPKEPMAMKERHYEPQLYH